MKRKQFGAVSKTLAASDINALREAAEQLGEAGVVARCPVQVFGVDRTPDHRPVSRILAVSSIPLTVEGKARNRLLLGPDGDPNVVPWGIDYEHPFFVFFPNGTDNRDRILVHCSQVVVEVLR